jgi:WXG100 family type VII secretion target
MSQLSVDPEQLRSTAADLNAQSEFLQSCLDQYAGSVGILMSQWQGDAAGAAASRIREWDHQMSWPRRKSPLC